MPNYSTSKPVALDIVNLSVQTPPPNARPAQAYRFSPASDRDAHQPDLAQGDPPNAATADSGVLNRPRFSVPGTLTPLYAAGTAILLVIAITSPLIHVAPDRWYRSGAALCVMAIILLAWRRSQRRLLPERQNEFIQFAVMLGATGMCVAAQLWHPYVEIAHGFVIVPLVLSVMFRTLRVSVVANVIIALAWAATWYSTGMPFSASALLGHLVYVPTLSIALALTQQGALRELAAYHEGENQRIQERHDALRQVAEEASRRAKSEAELHRQHALLESILATVPDEIFVKDRQRRVIVANRSYLNAVDKRLDEVLGSNTDDLLPADLAETSRLTDEAVLNQGAYVHREVTAKYADGAQKVYDLEKLPLVEDGEITGIVGIAREVTARKEAERRLKEQEILLLHAARLSSMGELVAGIAHEVNQPLYSILNYSKAVNNLLANSPTPNLDDIRNWNEQVLKEATRGGKITKRLRSFVRRAETQRERACLTAIVRESVDFIAAEARRARVQIDCGLSQQLPEVLVDRVQIQQVLVNLLMNAIEALAGQAADAGRIVVSTRRVDDGVEVAVADNGPGIPAHQSSDILEPFFTTKHQGIGLGLTISNTIIRAHESKLNYQRNDWGGATFHFTLNCAA